jgi:hypothetical protein
VKRIFPRNIQDKIFLSYILERYLSALQTSALQVSLAVLAYDAHIPASIFLRLVRLQHNPEDAPYIEAEDFHILFSNILFRYPTVKIWLQNDGEVFIEL